MREMRTEAALLSLGWGALGGFVTLTHFCENSCAVLRVEQGQQGRGGRLFLPQRQVSGSGWDGSKGSGQKGSDSNLLGPLISLLNSGHLLKTAYLLLLLRFPPWSPH